MDSFEVSKNNVIHKGIKVNFKKRDFTYLFFIIFGSLLFIRDVKGLEIGREILIFISMLVFLIGDLNSIFSFCVFIAPIHTGSPYNFIIVLAALTLIVKKRIFKFTFVVIPAILMLILLEFVSAFRSVGVFSVSKFIQIAASLILLFFILADRDMRIDASKAVNSYMLGFGFAIINIFGQMLNEYSFMEIFSLRIRLGNVSAYLNKTMTGMCLSYNPNMLGGICALSAMLCLILIKKRSFAGKILYFVLFFVSSITCFMTLSRSAILAYILGIFYFFLFSGGDMKTQFKKITILLLLVFVICYTVINYLGSYLTFFFDRFKYSDILNNRGRIFGEYLNVIFSSIDKMLIGVGLQDYTTKCSIWDSAHNAIEEVLIAWGIIGLILVIILSFIALNNCRKNMGKIKLFQLAPLITYFIILQAGQGFSVRGNVLLVMSGFSALLFDNNNSN